MSTGGSFLVSGEGEEESIPLLTFIFQNREVARQSVIDYIEMFYNSQRLHSYLDYKSPNDYEAAGSVLIEARTA